MGTLGGFPNLGPYPPPCPPLAALGLAALWLQASWPWAKPASANAIHFDPIYSFLGHGRAT